LHHEKCKQSEEDFARMDRILASDPAALERLQLCINYEAYEEEIPENEISRMMVPPVHHASRKGHVECLKFLSKKGANMNSLHNGMTPLSIHQLDDTLFVGEKYEVVEALLEIGAKVSGEYGQHGFEMLKGALCEDDDIVMENLINYGCPVENLDPQTGEPIDDCSPLLKSLESSVPNCFSEMLLISGAKFAFPQNCKPMMEHLDGMWLTLQINFNDDPHLDPDWDKRIKEFINEAKSDFLQKLHLFLSFGGRIVVPYNELNVADYLHQYFTAKYLEKFQTIQEQHSQSLKVIENMFAEIADMTRDPLSLQSLARIAVRNAMGRDMLKNIKFLPIPETLKDFMRFKDVLKEIEINNNSVSVVEPF
jgi:hypothetical protein